ncbi:LysR family transcriptional regulator [Pseudomonas panipatensis]|uniref:LysR family transcriptional regulator n=1 Tax=Pseudomonas panipatensis TaxID=428992 RepID=UPI0035AF7345
MEFRQLRSFVEVVRQGSFTQAAAILHASQSAVSKQVAQLEQSLQVQLLERSGPHIRPTAAGNVVLRRAEDMLRLRRELLTELDELSQMKRGELRLGLPLLGADPLFAWRFAEYRKRYPQIQVRLLEGGSKTLEQAVRAGELELAGCLTPSDTLFDWQEFCNEPLDALLPADHPLAERPSIALRELADTPFLLYQQSFTLNDRLLRACHEAGFEPREGGRSGQADFLGALVAAGQGVVLLPRAVAREIERPGVVRVLLSEPDLRWDICFIWRRDAYLSHAARAWLELLKENPLRAAESEKAQEG